MNDKKVKFNSIMKSSSITPRTVSEDRPIFMPSGTVIRKNAIPIIEVKNFCISSLIDEY